ncbi:hypothetical protein A2U01_0078164 [Trifolium medium]|uniref:Uncharacterized protein n=1 Tax=Trifolium medium TaxID=97028 RepID=A0A392T735_9FABA|nr:hypothetical protein [Trifolium medium]
MKRAALQNHEDVQRETAMIEAVRRTRGAVLCERCGGTENKGKEILQRRNLEIYGKRAGGAKEKRETHQQT